VDLASNLFDILPTIMTLHIYYFKKQSLPLTVRSGRGGGRREEGGRRERSPQEAMSSCSSNYQSSFLLREKLYENSFKYYSMHSGCEGFSMYVIILPTLQNPKSEDPPIINCIYYLVPLGPGRFNLLWVPAASGYTCSMLKASSGWYP